MYHQIFQVLKLPYLTQKIKRKMFRQQQVLEETVRSSRLPLNQIRYPGVADSIIKEDKIPP